MTIAGLPSLFVTGEPVRTRINRRQDLPTAWMMNGAIYVFRTAVLFDASRASTAIASSPIAMPAERGISIDDPKTGPQPSGPLTEVGRPTDSGGPTTPATDEQAGHGH